MNIGIIQIKDKQYYIQKTNTTYKVECITDEKAFTLTKEETIDLIKNIFSSDMKKISEENNLTIYEDAAKNKRFFEDGVENYLYFFYYNGEDALLYQGKLSEHFKDLVKEIKMNSKVYGLLAIYATIELFLYVGMLSGNFDIPEFPKEEYYFLSTTQMTAEELIDDYTFALKEKLPDEKIAYLCNRDLFEDVLRVATPARKHILRKYTSDIDYTYFTKKELETETDINGYYDTVRNKISLKDNSDKIFYNSSAHEVAHSLQDHNKYIFIREACAEIIAYEYNGQEKFSYKVPRNHVDALMELIGPQPVFECNFKGDTTSFEEAIKTHLSKEEAEELLELFTHSPLYNDNFEEEAKRIESLILKMYENIHHKSASDDRAFLAVLSGSTDKRLYFNTHNEQYDMDFSFLYHKKIREEIDKENISCYVYEKTYILSEEEFNKLKNNPGYYACIKYAINDGYHLEDIGDGELIITNGINSYSINEAEEKGIVSIERSITIKRYCYTLEDFLDFIEKPNYEIDDFYESSVKKTIIRKDNNKEYKLLDIEDGIISCYTTEETYETLPSMREKFPDQMNFDEVDEKVY